MQQENPFFQLNNMFSSAWSSLAYGPEEKPSSGGSMPSSVPGVYLIAVIGVRLLQRAELKPLCERHKKSDVIDQNYEETKNNPLCCSQYSQFAGKHHSINNKGLKSLHLQLSPWKQLRRDRSLLYFKRKRREKKNHRMTPNCMLSSFFLAQLKGTNIFFRFGREKALQRLGFLLKGVLSYKLAIDLGYARDLYKLVPIFDGTCLPPNKLNKAHC